MHTPYTQHMTLRRKRKAIDYGHPVKNSVTLCADNLPHEADKVFFDDEKQEAGQISGFFTTMECL